MPSKPDLISVFLVLTFFMKKNKIADNPIKVKAYAGKSLNEKLGNNNNDPNATGVMVCAAIDEA